MVTTIQRANVSDPGTVGPNFQRRRLKAYRTGQRLLKGFSLSFLARLPRLSLAPFSLELLDQPRQLLLPLLA